MEPLKWRDDYAINNELIDRQHRELFARVNTFLAACALNKHADEIGELFMFLESYTIVHFMTEEQIQRESGYPDYGEHLKMHHGFIDTLRFLRERFESGGPTPGILREMQTFVSNWLVQHVTLEDKALGKHLQNKPKRNQPSNDTTVPIQDRIRPL